MDSEFSCEAVRVFKALSDPTRYEIVRMLLRNGEMGCGDFECVFLKSRPAMSHHYRVLENAGLVAYRKQGLRVFYRLEREQLERFVPRFHQIHCGSRDETTK